MKIGIDISQMAFPGTGVAVYTENLVKNLLKIDKENEYILFYSSLRQKLSQKLKVKSQNHNSKVKSYRIPPLILETIWNRLHILPVETFTGKLDIFHSSDWLEPPAKCFKVTTIHDLAVLKYPETFAARGGHDIVANHKRKLELVKKESKLIIAVSESTKRDIVELMKVPEDRIRVVYEAGDSSGSEITDDNVDKIKNKYGIDGKYILAVGTREPRKNLKRVIEAHNILVSQYPDISLVIAGKYGWGADLDRDRERVRVLGYVPREDLAGLYRGAECFVCPSLYEGFGLPILEAMSNGCPVVTSNISSMPEIAGKAGVLVNPESVEEIAQGINEVIVNRRKYSEKGLIRVKDFSWEKTAKQTMAIYKEAVNI